MHARSHSRWLVSNRNGLSKTRFSHFHSLPLQARYAQLEAAAADAGAAAGDAAAASAAVEAVVGEVVEEVVGEVAATEVATA